MSSARRHGLLATFYPGRRARRMIDIAGQSEVEANARLIAAAPDRLSNARLLDAMQPSIGGTADDSRSSRNSLRIDAEHFCQSGVAA